MRLTTLICFFIFQSCVNQRPIIYKNSALNQAEIIQTYLAAEKAFKKNTNCLPLLTTLTIIDCPISQINDNLFSSIGNNIPVAIGMYNLDNKIIYLLDSHPDKPRVLFHEILHLLFDSSECSVNVNAQHFIINQLVKDYLKITGRKELTYDWLDEEINKYRKKGN